MDNELSYAQIYLITLAVCEILFIGIVLAFFNIPLTFASLRYLLGINLLILVGNLVVSYVAYFLYDNSVF